RREALRRGRNTTTNALSDRAAYVFSRTATENDGLEEGIRSKAVGAVKSSARAFADGPESGERRPRAPIPSATTHMVVGRGGHRDGLGRRINARASARRVHRRKTFRKAFTERLGAVEKYSVTRGKLAMNGPRDDITRSELGIRVYRRHEAAP